MLIGTAKLSPWPPAMIAVLTPTTAPVLVTSGPPELPGIECRVGLDHVLDQPAGPRAKRAAERAHHAGRDGVLEAVGVADGDDELAGPKRLRVAELDRGQVGRA